MKDEFKTDGPHSPDGTPWWQVRTTPGTQKQKFGGEKRLAAYLNFNVAVGDTFTMRQLRQELGAGGLAEDAEHLNRRLRRLRPDGWGITSNKDDRSIPSDTYRLDAIGTRVWLGERNRASTISDLVRRQVLERDDHTCVVCGVRAGEEYDDLPGKFARLTAGHRVPGQRQGGATLDELQAECSRCNETVRDRIGNPETYAEVLPEVRGLKSSELKDLRKWLAAGQRTRSKTEQVHARIRRLAPSERVRMTETINRIIG